MVTPEAARLTGLQAGVPVIIGGHDHICAAVAAGAITPEVVLDSAGTAEALMVTRTKPLLDPDMSTSGLCCGCHTARDRYYLIGGFLCGGVLAWVSRVLAADDSPEAISRLMEEAASSPPGANGVWFVPHLQGSGPPKRDPRAWGAWLGLRLGHTRADLARAAVEGISYAIRFMLEALLAGAGISARELRCVGGGTRSTFWQQVKADVIGIPIDTPAIADVTAQGAALLAGIGVGAFTDEADAACKAYHSAVRYIPQTETLMQYDTAYRQIFFKLNALYQDISL
jgi:xylulokinase